MDNPKRFLDGGPYCAQDSPGLPALSESDDVGRTWSPARLTADEPEDIQYQMNQQLIQRADGRLVLPICSRDPRIPVRRFGEGVHPTMAFCCLSDDEGRSWRRSRGVVRQDTERGVQEPAAGE